MCMVEAVEMVADMSLRPSIYEDLKYVYRFGKFDDVLEDNRSVISRVCSYFINTCRARMQDAVGFPAIFDAVAEKEVDMSVMLQDEVETNMSVVREMNTYVAISGRGSVPRLYNENGKLTEEAKAKFVEYIKFALEHREVLFAQTVMYYDLQTNFVFDDQEMILNGKTYEWRQFLGRSSDEILACDGVLYLTQYLSYEVLCEMKYYSKYMYKVYCFRRRFSKTVRLSRIDSRFVSYTGTKFWCNFHDRFFCPHNSVSGQVVPDVELLCPSKELSFFRDLLEKLSDTDLRLLKVALHGRDFFEVVSAMVVFFIRAGKSNGELMSFVHRYEDFIRIGMVVLKLGASKLIVNRISDMFRRKVNVFLKRLSVYDLRDDGVTNAQRINDPRVVDRIMETRMLAVDMEELFTEAEVPPGSMVSSSPIRNNVRRSTQRRCVSSVPMDDVTEMMYNVRLACPDYRCNNEFSDFPKKKKRRRGNNSGGNRGRGRGRKGSK